MRDITKLKYKLNYNPAVYNYKTKQYESGSSKFLSYEQARSTQWKCEKCNKFFPSFKDLKLHKIESHSY